jgi:hypothetical protein
MFWVVVLRAVKIRSISMPPTYQPVQRLQGLARENGSGPCAAGILHRWQQARAGRWSCAADKGNIT